MSFNSYNTLPELLSMLSYSKDVLSRLTSRRSNDMMFLRDDEEGLKKLYNKTTRLSMYIDTLEIFLKCSPLYPNITCECEQVNIADLEAPREFLSDDLREHYKSIYSRLFTCIQLLISSIPSNLYNRIEYDSSECLSIDDTEDPPLPCVDILGSFDLSFDFSFDVGVLCNTPTPPIVLPTIYYGESGKNLLDNTEIVAELNFSQKSGFIGNYNFAAGGYKYFVFPDSWGSPLGFRDNGVLPMAMSLTLGTLVSANTDFSYYTVTINAILYRVYRTLNKLGSSILIEVE